MSSTAEEGMEEATAIGKVIGEFGSIDDLKEALNLEEPSLDAFDSTTVDTYLKFIPKFATAILWWCLNYYCRNGTLSTLRVFAT
ncbi:hypothetical protein MGH68_16800 [Erysipelothrix sp. D19-032]